MAWGDAQIKKAQELLASPDTEDFGPAEKAILRKQLQDELTHKPSTEQEEVFPDVAHAEDPDVDHALPNLTKRKSLYRPPEATTPGMSFPKFYYEPKRKPGEDQADYDRRADAAWTAVYDNAKQAGENVIRYSQIDTKGLTGKLDKAGGALASVVAGGVTGLSDGMSAGLINNTLGAVFPKQMANIRQAADPTAQKTMAIAGALVPQSLPGQLGRGLAPLVEGGGALSRIARAAPVGAAVAGGTEAVSEAGDAARRAIVGEEQDPGARDRIVTAMLMGGALGPFFQGLGEGGQKLVDSFRTGSGKGHQVRVFEDGGGQVAPPSLSQPLGGLRLSPEMEAAQKAALSGSPQTPEDIMFTQAADASLPPVQRLQGAQRGAVDATGRLVADAAEAAPRRVAQREDELSAAIIDKLNQWRDSRKALSEGENAAFYNGPAGQRPSPSDAVGQKLMEIVGRNTAEGLPLPFSGADKFQTAAANLVRQGTDGAPRPANLNAQQLDQLISILDDASKFQGTPKGDAKTFEEIGAAARQLRSEAYPELAAIKGTHEQRIAEEQGLMSSLGLEGVSRDARVDSLSHADRLRSGLRKVATDVEPLPGPEQAPRRGQAEAWMQEQGLGDKFNALKGEMSTAAELAPLKGETPWLTSRAGKKAVENAFKTGDFDAIERYAGPEQAMQLRKMAEDTDKVFSTLGLERAGNVSPGNSEYMALRNALMDFRKVGNGPKDSIIETFLANESPEALAKLKAAAGMQAYQSLRGGGTGIRGVSSPQGMKFYATLGDAVRYRLDPLFKGLSQSRVQQPGGAVAGATAEDVDNFMRLMDAVGAQGEEQ